MTEPKRKLTQGERALLRLSRDTLKHLRHWPDDRDAWWADIEAGKRFKFWPPGEQSRHAWEQTNDIYEAVKRNVERLG
jgi:hypothetical protein